MLMVTQLKDTSLITTVQCTMVNNLKVHSVNNGNQQVSVQPMDQNVPSINHKEVGVHLKDLTQLLLKALKNNNHSVFLLEVGLILLILHTQLQPPLLQLTILLTLLMELTILAVKLSLMQLILILNIYLIHQLMEQKTKELLHMPLWSQLSDNNYLIWYYHIVPDLTLSQITAKMELHSLQIKKDLLLPKLSLTQD